MAVSLFNCSNDNTVQEPDDDSHNEVNSVQTFGGSLNDSGKSIVNAIDGGYVILGHTQSTDGDVLNKQNNSFDYWLLKFDSESNLQWQKTYGGTDDDRGNSIIQTNDGGYAMLGYSQSNDGDVSENNGFNDFWISKLNASGDILWQKTFGFSGADTGISIIQTHDNGFLLSGILDVSASGGQGNSKSSSTKHAGGDYWIIKLNADGTKEWSQFYGGTFTDTPNGTIQTTDNSYIIVGSSDSDDIDINNNKGSDDFWVVKISETGRLIWEKSFGGSQIDEAYAITNSADGNYIIVGDTRSNDSDITNNKGAADLWLIKITTDGTLIWEKTFGGTSFDAGRSIFKTQDNGFIISGNSRSTDDDDVSSNNGQNDAWILKVDTNANLKWQKTIGGFNIDLAFDSVQLSNGDIITTGETSSGDLDIIENKGFTDLLIIKTTE
ncbi:MAG: hypothetical protein ABJK28_10935 [Algibacter sp.]